eukprot:755045-Hanusia_phi.AAC.1
MIVKSRAFRGYPSSPKLRAAVTGPHSISEVPCQLKLGPALTGRSDRLRSTEPGGDRVSHSRY